MSRFWMGLLLIGVLLCGLWFPATAQVYEQEMPADWQEKDVLRITAFAVGEGDALLLQCGGESMMVDGGPKPFRDPMKAAMEQRGIRHFKYLLNTHSHDDHIDGLYSLMLNGFTADEYLHPYTEWWARADKELHGRTIQLTEKLGIPNRQVGEGDTLTLGGAELKLHRYLGDMAMEAVEAQYAEHRDSEFYSDEAESVTDEYVAFCIETIEAVRSSCPDPLIMVEHRLDYSEYVPEGFGTGDLVIVADGVIEVIDFKSGRGVRVDANRNSQLMLYALGALLEFDSLYDIHHVRMTIVQPRLNNLSSYELEADELLRWADTIEEIKTVCWCGRKATFNARVQDGHIVREGEQIMMGGNSAYVSLCRRHWKDGNLGSFCNLNLED